MARSWFFRRHGNPYIYIPNLIGYLRIASAFLAIAVALKSPSTCVLLYSFGFICDELDGRFARMFGQTTMLGQVLDMVTDRLSTAGLLAVLGILNRQWYFCFLLLLMLDIFSHWFQMYATLAAGADTHKDTGSQSAIVRFYYQHRIFMGFCCICCEVLYLSLYLLHFPEFQIWPLVPLHLPASLQERRPGAGKDGDGMPLAIVIAALAVPGFALKQFINWVQLRTAMQQLVATDRDKANQTGGKAKVKLDKLSKVQ